MSTRLPPNCTPADWFATPLGSYLLERELAYFDATVADVFGFNAFQLGLPDVDFLRASRIPVHARVGLAPGVDVRADPCELPIATGCADLVVLPHVLEFADDPHQVLREVARVLMPEGHVVISGFNPWSLWGARRLLPMHESGGYPWSGNFINLMRLKDWLQLLGFEVSGGQMDCYVPPVSRDQWLERFSFMEDAGDRWWPIAGGVYFLEAIRRVRGMRLIMPRWSDRLAPKKALAAVPQRDQAAARGGLDHVE